MSSPDELWQRVLAAPADADLKAQFVAALDQAGDPRAKVFALEALYQDLRKRDLPDNAALLKPDLDAALGDWRTQFALGAAAWPGQIQLVGAWPMELTINAADFVRNAAAIVATIPLRHLNITAISDAPAVFDVPQFEQIASLDGSKQPWSDDAIRALAGSAHVGALRWIDLSRGDISESQVEILAASSALKTVEVMNLTNNPTRDPVDAAAGYGTDWRTNRIVLESIYLPEFGSQLEARYGKIAWLNGLWNFLEDYPPSRYSF
jgi:hypothetical protein